MTLKLSFLDACLPLARALSLESETVGTAHNPTALLQAYTLALWRGSEVISAFVQLSGADK